MHTYKRFIEGTKAAYRISIFIAVILIASSCTAFSQGEYLKKGQSGIGFGAGFAYSKTENMAGVEVSGGYSNKGIFDIGLSVSRLSLNTSEVTGFVISPSVTLHIKPDSDAAPFFGSISAGYEEDSYSSALDRGGSAPPSGSFLTLGISISGNIYASQMIYLQPSIGLAYLTGTLGSEGNSQHEQTTAFLAGISFVFMTSSRNSLAITPSIGVDKNQTTFSIAAAFVLGSSK